MRNKNTIRQKRPPNIPLDWDLIDKFLEADATGVEIAAYFGINEETLYLRCQKEKHIVFSAYKAQKRSKGDILLKAKQMSYAMTGKQGNLGMLIWLGKNRLGQKDDPVSDIAFNGTLAKKLDTLKGTLEDKEENGSNRVSEPEAD